MKRGEVWWAGLGSRRAAALVVIWQSETLTSVLQSVLVVPLTTNLTRANLAGNESEVEELELATDEALGRVEPK